MAGDGGTSARAGGAGERQPYTFEIEQGGARRPPGSHRSHDDAAQALTVLRTRLDVPHGATLAQELEHELLRYCVDVILNVTWYDRARRREESKNAWMTAFMIALMIVALVLVGASSLASVTPSVTTQNGVLQLTLFAGGALTVLQVIAALGDGKARLTIFWKASADLKEALYTFERRWRGKCTAPGDGGILGPDPEFAVALADAIGAAHAVTRAERLDFFATLRSPSDVAAIATTAFDSFRGRRADIADQLGKRDDGFAEARHALTAARAAVAASEFRLKALTDADAKKTEERTLLDVRAEVVRAESVVRAMSSG
ncbi:MAG TPA: hypothetical protein VHU80_15155 [Polyangiaceae bacterium]|jgi:hypothetical protein|nr:hypothetical protein [Polyangiaceae bacterium]